MWRQGFNVTTAKNDLSIDITCEIIKGLIYIPIVLLRVLSPNIEYWYYSEEHNAAWMLEKNTRSLEQRTLQSGSNLRKSYRWKLSSVAASSTEIQHESGDQLFVCSKCGIDYGYQGSFEPALNYPESIEKRNVLVCPNCGKEYTLRKNWQTGDQVYYQTRLNRQHLKAATGNQPLGHVCQMCGKAYKQRYNLTRHLKYECNRNPRFKCPLCIYQAKRRAHIISHVKTVHDCVDAYAIDLEPDS
ncbi:gastrula zinc finger protein XlCGF8.2DB-like [Belonocnema kinseyi]|uniref:gastrula zinc finger protein XlCGF8.2DB-like n=1 Tax=Belonocnema kinseyi TaxID=2817044 RepID=UPI00143D43FB|nr:gastrula zinc finger protein XlCGF8.2DB-like [Belonocnema kinseyi]